MSEKRTKSYLLYAFGEIILVVIGILIALSINNWSQNRQNKKILTIYTNQLIEEIDINISKLNKIIEEESNLKIQLDTVILLLNDEDYSNPKLIQKSYALLTFEDFNPESIAFENLKTSGEFKLIDNIDLRNAISSAYNSFEQVKLTQEVHYYNMKTRIADYFLENANYRNIMQSTPNFGKDLVFGNLVLAASSTLTQKVEACKISLNEMKQLKGRLSDFKTEEL